MKSRCFSFFLAANTVLFSFATVACRTEEINESLVRVDNDHYLWREDAKPYLIYKIPAGDEFILDAEGYQFDTSQFMYNFDSERGEYADIELSPNIIQILIGQIAIGDREDASDTETTTNEAYIYRAEWNPSSQQQRIHAPGLVPVGESPPLLQFQSGQEMIIEIGRLEKDSLTDQKLFYPFWSGIVDIQ